MNGDVLPTLLVDGYIAGERRPVEKGSRQPPSIPSPTKSGKDLRQTPLAAVAPR
jgi:hypothetical protein